eukprot:s23_g4.t1
MACRRHRAWSSQVNCLWRRSFTGSSHIETPLIFSDTFSKHLGADVKLDLLQPSGSFKLRGIGLTVKEAAAAGAKCVVSSSGGNAGLAAAFAARDFKLPCTVVLPTTTPESVQQHLAFYGADVMVHGSVWDEADRKAREVVEERQGAYESTWRGHATLVEELQRQLPSPPDAIVTCVGGGGLLMGILQGVEVGWKLRSSRVIACETVGANCLAESLEAQELVTLPQISSIAKSLGALRPSEAVFERCLRMDRALFRSAVFSDSQALAACLRLADDHRLLVEPACGAAIAAVTEKSEALQGMRSVVLQLCGGAVISRSQLAQWAAARRAGSKDLLERLSAQLDVAARVQLPLQRELDLLILDVHVSERWRSRAKEERKKLDESLLKLQDLYQIAVDLGFYHLVLVIVDLTSSTQDMEAGFTAWLRSFLPLQDTPYSPGQLQRSCYATRSHGLFPLLLVRRSQLFLQRSDPPQLTAPAEQAGPKDFELRVVHFIGELAEALRSGSPLWDARAVGTLLEFCNCLWRKASGAAASDWVALEVLAKKPFQMPLAALLRFYTAVVSQLPSWSADLRTRLDGSSIQLSNSELYLHLSQVVLCLVEKAQDSAELRGNCQARRCSETALLKEVRLQLQELDTKEPLVKRLLTEAH